MLPLRIEGVGLVKSHLGYHVTDIPKGVYGELSKIQEEVAEAIDADSQGNRLMTLVELSDIIGAIEGYLEKHHSDIGLDDLVKFSQATKRAFDSGERSCKDGQ